MMMENYVVLSFIGEGSFGRVFKAKHKETDHVVALKVIRKKGRSSKDLKNLKQECDIQRELNHPNIIRMIESFDTDSELVVVTEFAEKELHGVLAKEGCLDEEKVKRITCDLVSALYYLHSHRVLHRDLKPQNVLIDSEGHAKLCDFGLARAMTNSTHILTSIKGTPLYMAPELIDEKPYDHQADLWSLGCIVYELMAGQPPFCTMSIWQLVRMIRHKPVQWPSFISAEARSFLQGLLHKDPSKRMSWPEILEHSFVAGNVLILPEDENIESPFTKPLTHSQQELKQLQREQISTNSRLRQVSRREHDLRAVRPAAGGAGGAGPVSDDDSVRAASALSVRDSLRTDDDEPGPLSAPAARLLRHEYRLDSSNLLVAHLDNNMADLGVKMAAIDEEQAADKRDSPEKRDERKSADAASHSLENPKSKSGSELSGLSKSVPPSYTQKILQFSRDKLRFGSGGNKLTRSIKRSFHFSRSWDKGKSERRVSEPAARGTGAGDGAGDTAGDGVGDTAGDTVGDGEAGSKDLRHEDAEKADVIADAPDADNDEALLADDDGSAMQLQEWEAFLHSNIAEAMDGDVAALAQLNMVRMVLDATRAARRGAGAARVCAGVAALLALPAAAAGVPRRTLLDIQDVYLEAEVVGRFVAATAALVRSAGAAGGAGGEARVAVDRMLEVAAWLCVRSCRAVRQFAAAAADAAPELGQLLALGPQAPRIVLNIVGLLATVLQDRPERACVVERVLAAPGVELLPLLGAGGAALRGRVCMLVSLLAGGGGGAWARRHATRLAALRGHSNVAVSRAARLAARDLANVPPCCE